MKLNKKEGLVRLAKQELLSALFMMIAFCATAKETPEQILKLLPTEVEGTSAKPIHVYPEPESGASIGYNFDVATVTLYIYDLGETNIENGIASEFILSVKNATVEGIATGDTWQNSKVISDGSKEFALGNNKKISVLFTQFTLEDKNTLTGVSTQLRSDLYILGTKAHICKIRITRPANNSEAQEQKIEKIISELLSKIAD